MMLGIIPMSVYAKCGGVNYSWGADALASMHDYVVTMMLYVLYICYALATVVGIISALQITIKMNIGEDGVKKVRVLSGGEKVRCMLSKLMISGANVLLLDEPTDHLDMESITALNNGLIKFPGVLLFSSRDHQIVQTTANRIIEILPNGSIIDKITTYDEYLESDEMARKRTVYSNSREDEDDN